MATATKTKARLEARIDAALDDLITEAADRLHVTKTASSPTRFGTQR